MAATDSPLDDTVPPLPAQQRGGSMFSPLRNLRACCCTEPTSATSQLEVATGASMAGVQPKDEEPEEVEHTVNALPVDAFPWHQDRDRDRTDDIAEAKRSRPAPLIRAAPRRAEAMDAALSARLAGMSTAAEKAQVRETLQTLVIDFTKQSLRGCMCTYIKEGAAKRFKAQYRLDRGLENLVVICTEDKAIEYVCPLVSIRDIFSLAEDDMECFPPEIISQVRQTEHDRLVMVVYRGHRGKEARFCLLEESARKRDIFMECLMILRIFSEQRERMADARA